MSYYFDGTFAEFMIIWMFWFEQIGLIVFMILEVIINEVRR